MTHYRMKVGDVMCILAASYNRAGFRVLLSMSLRGWA